MHQFSPQYSPHSHTYPYNSPKHSFRHMHFKQTHFRAHCKVNYTVCFPFSILPSFQENQHCFSLSVFLPSRQLGIWFLPEHPTGTDIYCLSSEPPPGTLVPETICIFALATHVPCFFYCPNWLIVLYICIIRIN